MTQADTIRSLITRLARIDASESWDADLNPAQRAALDYIGHANRFSRAPSQAAAFLGTTRGTTTQTFKALARKGYVTEQRSLTDKRSISYDLTDSGVKQVAHQNLLAKVVAGLDPTTRSQLEQGLRRVLADTIRRNDNKPFGVCKSCRHFEGRGKDGFCRLLHETLEPYETLQICHEQEPA